MTDSYRGSNRGVETANQGTSVLTLIYERDANSKESRKSRGGDKQRHSFLDEVASENGHPIDTEAADSERKRSSLNSKFAP